MFSIVSIEVVYLSFLLYYDNTDNYDESTLLFLNTGGDLDRLQAVFFNKLLLSLTR